MRPRPRLPQLIQRSAGDDLAAVAQERLQHVFQPEQARLVVVQRHQVDAERVLQLGVLEQAVEQHIGLLVALHFNHDAHAGFVRFITQSGDALNLLGLDHLGDFLNQTRLVDLIGQLFHNDGFAPVVGGFHIRAGALHDLPAP